MSDFFSTDLYYDHAPIEAGAETALCASCAATGAWVRAKRLMTRSEVDHYLALTYDQVQWFIDTRQITAIRIKGEDRFDSRQLDLLVETYKNTAQRKA